MTRLDRPGQYRRARAGLEPAEVLTPFDRRVLIAALVRDGLDDIEIAEHTRWTTYTVGRLRDELRLRPNPLRAPRTTTASASAA